jgi:hypothetical protein
VKGIAKAEGGAKRAILFDKIKQHHNWSWYCCIAFMWLRNAVQTSINLLDLNDESNLLTTEDFVDISLGAPEGSGALRTLTIHYIDGNEQESNMSDEISRLDCMGYDDEAKEQTLGESDFNQDGIIEIIVYREFKFPDIELSHVEIPLWPTVYEYDLNKGFLVASAKYKDYFSSYAENIEEGLSADIGMSGPERVALKRLLVASQKIADGSFSPKSQYSHDNKNNSYYADVYDLVKNLTE